MPIIYDTGSYDTVSWQELLESKEDEIKQLKKKLKDLEDDMEVRVWNFSQIASQWV